MRLLVVHQNFPGQFGYFVREWARRPGWDVRGLGRDTAPGLPGFDGLILRYRLARQIRADQHLYLRQTEASTLHGQAAARAMIELRRSGFIPDAILAHPGWGETLFAKDVFPDARLVHFCEWFYSAEGADLGFDPEFPLRFDDRARLRIWNAQHALDLIHCDAAVSPTQWQRSRYPEVLQHKVIVQHEGIDADGLGPDDAASLVLPSGQVLRAGDPVITYVARNLEPYRGFHVFMRALECIQQADRQCHAVIVGGDEVSYGGRPEGFRCWRDKMLSEVKLDPLRTHFVGRVPKAQYVRLLQVSAAHVYLTYPFVLSWSLLEAMACGAPIVASSTAPVLEAIRDGINGRLVDFSNPSDIARGVLETLHDDPAAKATRCAAARRDACTQWRQADALPRYEGLLRPATSATLAKTIDTRDTRELPGAIQHRLASLADERRREARLREVLMAR
ncbi:glycosyltransferase family 4 protein [Piscinibacter sakaiensis]|uniref:glycosyltransferase family 4 protein n=1 Tax=Piscinibacter sakaiensis TaxID=1547922 RepID=UPI003AAC46F8